MRIKVPYFQSYAHLDHRLADDLLDRLHRQLAPSQHYDYRPWRDREQILTGENWFGQITQALDDCRLGLLLVSPAFLASKFIDRHELPRFVGADAKPVIPVVLQPVNVQRHDLKGLQEYQLFWHNGQRAYGQCDGRARDRFVEELFEQIERRLDRITGRAA